MKMQYDQVYIISKEINMQKIFSPKQMCQQKDIRVLSQNSSQDITKHQFP